MNAINSEAPVAEGGGGSRRSTPVHAPLVRRHRAHDGFVGVLPSRPMTPHFVGAQPPDRVSNLPGPVGQLGQMGRASLRLPNATVGGKDGCKRQTTLGVA